MGVYYTKMTNTSPLGNNDNNNKHFSADDVAKDIVAPLTNDFMAPPIVAHEKPAVKRLDLLSKEEMEQEFNKIYQHSQHLLNTITHSPCEELNLRIQQCLKTHSNEMVKCFAVMRNYESCLADKRYEKLLENMQNLGMD